MNQHIDEETLILFYYDEWDNPTELQEHLNTCPPCRQAWHHLQHTLNQCDSWTIPEPEPELAKRIWAGVKTQLPQTTPSTIIFKPKRRIWPALAIAAALVLSFGLGWFMPHSSKAVPSGQAILQQSVLHHLEKSQRFLMEQRNHRHEGQAQPANVQADALLRETRFYRAVSLNGSEASLGQLLEELERLLAEIANADATSIESQLDQSDGEIELLFKIKVVGNKLRAKIQPSQPQI